MTDEKKVWVFFYGREINLEVLSDAGVVPESIDVAKLSGFEIVIQPQATLIRSFEHAVYGILTTASHAELEQLYNESFLAEAVLVETLDGAFQPALCHMAPATKARPADTEYIDLIVSSARALSFPASYIKHLESFRPH